MTDEQLETLCGAIKKLEIAITQAVCMIVLAMPSNHESKKSVSNFIDAILKEKDNGR